MEWNFDCGISFTMSRSRAGCDVKQAGNRADGKRPYQWYLHGLIRRIEDYNGHSNQYNLHILLRYSVLPGWDKIAVKDACFFRFMFTPQMVTDQILKQRSLMSYTHVREWIIKCEGMYVMSFLCVYTMYYKIIDWVEYFKYSSACICHWV